jgi:hypothetical protein
MLLKEDFEYFNCKNVSKKIAYGSVCILRHRSKGCQQLKAL